MKTKKTTLIAMTGLFGLGIVLLSFGKAEDPKFIRYEVIRSVDGEVKTYDTLIDANSTFTPEQYLAELGFASDENINIIKVPFQGPEMMKMHGMDWQQGCGDSSKIVTIEVNNEDFHGTDEPGKMMIKKNITVKTIDDGNGETIETIETVELVELDSLMELHMMNSGDSTMVFEQEIIIGSCDGKKPENFEWKTMEGEPTYERHTNDGNKKMDMMVFADG